MSCDSDSFSTKNGWEVLSHPYGFAQHHMIGVTTHLYSVTVNI